MGVSVQEIKMKKTSRKRAHDDSANAVEVSSSKKNKTDFNEVEFKLMLKDTNTTFQALEKFIDQAKKFPAETSFDLVLEYAQSSKDGREILQLLETESFSNRKPSELHLIFSALELILCRTTTGDGPPILGHLGETLCRCLLSNHLGKFYNLLTMRNKSTHIKGVLTLLTAMVMQGEGICQEIIMTFDLHHDSIQPLLNRRDLKDPLDVRTCLVQFFTAFLTTGDNRVIKQIVSTKGLLNSLFAGMFIDKEYTLQLIMKSLLEKVVKNPAISKTSKIRVFSEHSLKELARLYAWSGPKGWQAGRHHDTSQNQSFSVVDPSSLTESQEHVRQWLQELLLEVTCSYKHGINFLDKHYGTSSKNMNHTLTGLLQALDKPYIDPLKCELVTSILRACPDQIHRYLTSLQHAMTPRPSINWLACCNMLTQVYQSQPSVFKPVTVPDAYTAEQLCAMAEKTMVPPREIIQHTTQAVKNESREVSHAGLGLLRAVLENICHTLHYCDQSSTLPGSQPTDSATTHLQNFADLFKDSLKRALPSVQILMRCWSNATTKKPTSENQKSNSDNANQTTSLPAVDTGEHLKLLLQVLCAYQSLQPDTFRDQPPDYAALLDGVRGICGTKSTTEVSEGGMTAQQSAEIQNTLLQLLAACPSSLLLQSQKSDGKPVIHLLLEMATSTQGASLHFIIKMLLGTGVFGGCEEELSLWLSTLLQHTQDDGTATRDRLGLVCQCVETVLKKPHVYTERVLLRVEEAADLRAKMRDNTMEEDGSDSASTSLIEEDVAEERNIPVEETVSQRLPFTGLVPAVLDILTDEKHTASSWELIVHIIERLFRVQEDPLPLAVLLGSVWQNIHQQAAALGPLLHMYLPKQEAKALGLPKSPKAPVHDGATSSFGDLLQLWFMGTSDVDKGSLEEACRGMEARNCETAVRQILQYITIQAANTSKKHVVKTMKMLFNLLNCVVEDLQSNASQESAAATEETKTTDSTPKPNSIDKTKPSVMKSVCDILLKNNTLRTNFLATNFPHGSTITQNFARLVGILPSWVAQESHLIHFYTGRLVRHMMSGATDLTLQVLETFIPMMKDTTLLLVVDALLKYPTTSSEPQDGTTDSLSVSGQRAMEALSSLVKHRQVLLKHRLSYPTVQCVIDMAVTTTLPQLYDIVREVLQLAPLYSVCVQESHFKQVLVQMKTQPDLLPLVQTICSNHEAARGWLSHKLEKSKKPASTATLALAEVYLATCTSSASQMVYMLWEPLISILMQPTTETRPQAARVLSLLLTHTQHYDTLSGWHQSLSSQLQRTDTPVCMEAVCVYHSLLAGLLTHTGDTQEEAVVTGVHTLTHCFLGLAEQLKDNRDVETGQTVLSYILNHVKMYKETLLKARLSYLKENWSGFTKLALRHYFEHPPLLELLHHLLPVVYPPGEHTDADEAATAPSVQGLYMLVLAHSAFLPTMMASHLHLKECLVELLLTCVDMEPACCQTSHVTALLGAYGASLSLTDQRLLLLLHHYEKAGCDLTQYKPYLWGPQAAEKQAALRSLGPSLWRQPCVEDVIDHLDQATLSTSITHFPLKRTLTVQTEVRPAEEYKSIEEVYDPSFLLPLLTQLLGTEYIVTCRKFIESGCLSYAICALSSYDSQMRAAAYCILLRFYEHLDGARFAEREQVMCLLDYIRNSSERQGTKLACVISLFMANAARVLLTPDEHMYKRVNQWLLLRPGVDLMNVPQFFTLFNSAALEHDEERVWLMRCLQHSLRDTHDYHLYQRRYLFKQLLTFHATPLASLHTQRAVLEIVQRACAVKKAALDLVKHCGIVPWLVSTINTRSLDESHIGLYVSILSSLWFTLLDHRDDAPQPPASHPTPEAAEAKVPPCLPLFFSSQVLLACRTLMLGLGCFPSMSVLTELCGLLASVLSHLDKTSCLRKQESSETLIASVEVIPSDILLPMYHLAVLTDDKVRRQEVMGILQVSTAQILTKQTMAATTAARSFKTKRGPVENESQDSKTSSVGCGTHILTIVELWKPKVDETSVDVVLYVMQWTLEYMERELKGDFNRYASLVAWLCGVVTKTSAIQQALLTDSPRVRAIVNALLRTYSLRGTADKLEPTTKPENVHNKQVAAVQPSLDHLFVSLMTHATQTDTVSVIQQPAPIVHTLASKKYKKLIKTLTDTEREETMSVQLSLIIKQAWLGAKEPAPFCAS